MSSSSKKRQTMAKMTRERTVKEKRAKKQEKREERKLAAEAARSGEAVDSTLSPEIVDDETRAGEVISADGASAVPDRLRSAG